MYIKVVVVTKRNYCGEKINSLLTTECGAGKVWRNTGKLWITRANIYPHPFPSLKTLFLTHINNEKLHSCPHLIHNWGQPTKALCQPRWSSPCLLLNPVGELSDLVVDRSALSHQLTDFAVGMHNRCVVTPAECLADLW